MNFIPSSSGCAASIDHYVFRALTAEYPWEGENAHKKSVLCVSPLSLALSLSLFLRARLSNVALLPLLKLSRSPC